MPTSRHNTRRKGSLDRSNRLPLLGADTAPACIYIRVSTEEQQLSIAAQQKQVHAFADSHDIPVDSVFIDHGVSACKHAFTTRPQARAMVRHMRRTGISTVLVLRIDRAFRSVSDCYTTIPALQKMGIHFRFIDPDIDFTTPFGRACSAIFVAFAEFEADLRGQRQVAAFDQLRERRIIRNNNPPYGWDALPDPSVTTHSGRPGYRLVPNPREQEILRDILALYDGGRGTNCHQIAQRLNARSIPTKKAGQQRKWRGQITTIRGLWHMVTVKSVIEHADLATPAELSALQQ